MALGSHAGSRRYAAFDAHGVHRFLYCAEVTTLSNPIAAPRWFMTPQERPGASCLLYCLPYAGGSAAVYRTWGARLAPWIEVRAVELPGRGSRLREAPVDDAARLSLQVADAIIADADRPFAIFGHSMGAWLGYEVVRELEDHGHRPIAFFASGRQAPVHGCRLAPLGHLADDAFVAAMQARYDAIPAAVLAEPDLMALLLPALRADIRLLENYIYRGGPQLTTPIHAIVGADDRVVDLSGIGAWLQASSGPSTETRLPGGHFFFQPDANGVFALLERHLAGAGTDGARQ